MKIIYLSPFEGPQVSVKPGDVADVPDEYAMRLIERGLAAPVREVARVETAAAAPIVERAVSRKRKG